MGRDWGGGGDSGKASNNPNALVVRFGAFTAVAWVDSQTEKLIYQSPLT